MEKRDEFIDDATDLGTYLGGIGRRVLLAREALWGLNKTWREGESDESAQVVEQLSAELSQLGREVMLVQNQLCSKCGLKNVRKVIIFPENASKKED